MKNAISLCLVAVMLVLATVYSLPQNTAYADEDVNVVHCLGPNPLPSAGEVQNDSSISLQIRGDYFHGWDEDPMYTTETKTLPAGDDGTDVGICDVDWVSYTGSELTWYLWQVRTHFEEVKIRWKNITCEDHDDYPVSCDD